MSSSGCFSLRTYTAMIERSSETEITGMPIDRATRSAVRWRVPVSDVGTFGSGTRCTLARAMRLASEARMIAPSIFASSDSRCGLNAASSKKPPEQMLSTSGPSPTMISAPIFALRTRSRPSRSAVPGATARRAWTRSGLRRGTTARSYLCEHAHHGAPTDSAPRPRPTRSSAVARVGARRYVTPATSGADSGTTS